MDEKPENAIKRKRLTDKAAAYEEALQVIAAIHMHAIQAIECSLICKPAKVHSCERAGTLCMCSSGTMSNAESCSACCQQ